MNRIRRESGKLIVVIAAAMVACARAAPEPRRGIDYASERTRAIERAVEFGLITKPSADHTKPGLCVTLSGRAPNVDLGCRVASRSDVDECFLRGDEELWLRDTVHTRSRTSEQSSPLHAR
jgi:hypothetical protein